VTQRADLASPATPIVARLPPLVLAVVGLVMIAGFGSQLLAAPGSTTPWWASLFLALLAVAVTALGIAVTIDPHPVPLRRALAGSALAWLVILIGTVVIEVTAGEPLEPATSAALVGAAAAIALALWGLAVTTPHVSSDGTAMLGRVEAVLIFAAAIVAASAAAVVLVAIALRLWTAIAQGGGADVVPWGAVAVVILLPAAAFGIAAIGSRMAAGGTFYAQATTNRRNSALLLITMIGVAAATFEIIAVSLTFEPIPGLWAAGIGALGGLGAAAGANRFGDRFILDSAGAREAVTGTDQQLLDVVRELSLAAAIPMPRVFVIEDGSENAFATGKDPEHASVAVTRGLLDRMDREELQGVLGHELGHVRNLDTRYGLYVAVLVGLVAVVTDGFLRVIVEGWKRGAFYWKGSGKNAGSALAMGIAVGLFLLVVAALLRLLAPFFSALVQAASSREREFLADVTSVEFTRNPKGLERALEQIASDTDTLEAANRGTQHLWFRNPVKAGSDRRSGLLATHPSLGARIDRLRLLEGLGPLEGEAATETAEET